MKISKYHNHNSCELSENRKVSSWRVDKRESYQEKFLEKMAFIYIRNTYICVCMYV